ncbi:MULTISPECIES: hypothetical protein [unclassified Bradyrhizobium]|uniref:hypothetical protein n=1 Tax=unclassified Bradyrhizobium TaxID=2631580 RepID=UPI0028E3E373|nr:MULTISPECIES: hypothetical protein [unclassified Bradyrhizobium]
MISKETLRERIREPKKRSRSDWSKWIGSPTAWLALVLSSTTAYFNIRKYDDVTVVFGSLPGVLANPQSPIKIFGWKRNLVFINTGNRPVAIRGILLRAWFQSPNESAPRCSEVAAKHVLRIRYELEPLVVKPGEMTESKLEKSSSIEDEAMMNFKPPDSLPEPQIDGDDAIKWSLDSPVLVAGDVFSACLRVQVIRASRGEETVDVLIGSQPLVPSWKGGALFTFRDFGAKNSQVLIKN